MPNLMKKISSQYLESLPAWSLVCVDVIKYMLYLVSSKQYHLFEVNEISQFINFCCTNTIIQIFLNLLLYNIFTSLYVHFSFFSFFVHIM